MEIILTIAGSDSSAGAGIQQDLKTATCMGAYCATVITAITAQNTMGVNEVMAVPSEVVRAQLQAVFSDLDIKAVKIGMIPNIECAKVIVNALSNAVCPIVCDPVMISTSGTRLMSEDCIDFLRSSLFPLCTVITPNRPEAKRLNADGCSKLTTAMLIKGGHNNSNVMTDRLMMPDGTVHTYSSNKIDSTNLHGTGCTMSTAIAVGLARGKSLPEAVGEAKEIINRGIEGGKNLSIGHGNGPLWF